MSLHTIPLAMRAELAKALGRDTEEVSWDELLGSVASERAERIAAQERLDRLTTDIRNMHRPRRVGRAGHASDVRCAECADWSGTRLQRAAFPCDTLQLVDPRPAPGPFATEAPNEEHARTAWPCWADQRPPLQAGVEE